jgi:hypothetical protein
MKKFILSSLLFSAILFGSFITMDSFNNNKVEALGNVTFCNAVNATIAASVPNGFTYSNCLNTGSLLFTFSYDYNVTGFSSGSDGY